MQSQSKESRRGRIQDSRWRAAITGLILSAGVVVGVVGAGTQSASRDDPDQRALISPASPDPVAAKRFWMPFRLNARDSYSFRTLAAQALESDAVVAGRLSGLKLDRVFASDHPDGALPIAVVTLTIDESLKGALRVGSTVELELAMVGTPGQAKVSVGEGAAVLPQSQVVVFLRSIDEHYAYLKAIGRTVPKPPVPGRYTPINSVALWTASDRAPVDTPLSGSSDGEVAGQYPEELSGVRDMDAFKARVAEIIARG